MNSTFRILNSKLRTAPAQERPPLPLRSCRLVLAAGDSGFGRGKAGSAVGAVAEGLGRGTATTAQREGTLGNRVRISVPVHQRDVVTFHEVWTVPSDFDVRHTPLRLEPVQKRHATSDPTGLNLRVLRVLRGSFTPFSASTTGTLSSIWSYPSCRAAIPWLRPATRGSAPCAGPRCDSNPRAGSGAPLCACRSSARRSTGTRVCR